MENRSSSEITSFVLRFVQENQVDLTNPQILRGTIRHVQTDQRLSFTHWIEALNFMSKFVPETVFDLTDGSENS